MNGKTGIRRSPRHAGALAVAAAVAVMTAGCGVVHVNFGGSASSPSPAATGSITYAQVLALAQCMRGHGEPDFPDPDSSGDYNVSQLSVLNTSQGQAAYGACRHLLAGGGPSISQLQAQTQQAQQRYQQQLPTLVKYSQCMRSHGVPGFPDPPATPNGQSSPAASPGSDVNPDSAQAQAAASACQHLLPAGMHVSVGSSKARTSGS
jgi:hypothetical protein